MSLGFEQAGFDVVAAVDVDPIHVATHSENFPKCATIQADLSVLTGAELRKRAGLRSKRIDVVFGGPPCGGFSLIGKRRPEDSRNQLLKHFARMVKELRPRYFVLENVEGLLIPPMTDILTAFRRDIEAAGYAVVDPVKVLDASEYGVPQRRRRAFVLGFKRGLAAPAYPLPRSQLGVEGDGRPPTVWDAIGDLANLEKREDLWDGDVYRGKLGRAKSGYARLLRGEARDPEDVSHEGPTDGRKLTGCLRTVHTPDTVERFARTEPGSSEPVSRFYRLSKEGLCPTLRAGSDRSRGSFTAPRPIHPTQARCITVREGARLHSFPDWFRFNATVWHGFRQVGNSVPPMLARAVGRAVLDGLRSCETREPEGNSR
jgi:DNA (cytosine-5)-methyltransferase 1